MPPVLRRLKDRASIALKEPGSNCHLLQRIKIPKQERKPVAMRDTGRALAAVTTHKTASASRSTTIERLHSFLHLVFPLAVTSLLLTVAAPAYGKRHDLVIMQNGDHLSGEVKKLENGVLFLDTDYVSGSIQLNWLQVENVQSTGAYQIVLKDGTHLSGSIDKVSATDAPGRDFEIKTGNREVRAAGVDVVNIKSEKPNLWRQLTGAIDFGYDFTSGNSQTAFTSDASANYAATNWAAGASFTSSFSGQSHGSTTNLAEVQAFAERYLSRNSFLTGLETSCIPRSRASLCAAPSAAHMAGTGFARIRINCAG